MDDAKTFVLGMMQTVRERLGNPFVSAFAISWLIWNFRLVLIFVGDAGPGGWHQKIKYIDEKLMVSRADWFWHGFAVPTIGAAIWIFALPPALRWIAVWHEKNKSKAQEMIYDATKARVLSVEDAVALRAHVIDQRAAALADRERSAKALEDLLQTNNELLTHKSTLASQVAQQAARIAELEAPPPTKPIDINTLLPDERAKLLNIELGPSLDSGIVDVAWDRYSVVWPWQVPHEPVGQAIPAPLLGKLLPAHIVLALLRMDSQGVGRSRADWIETLRGAELPQAEETLNYLVKLGCFTYEGDQYITSGTVPAIRQALGRLGFATLKPRI